MRKLNRARLEQIFLDGHGFARARDVISAQIHPYHLNALEKQGTISRVKRGLYKWVAYDFDGNDELAEVARAIPKGILCLFSALSFHDLTNFEAGRYYIAIPRTDHVTLPPSPPIKVVYYSDAMYREGIDRVERGGQVLPVYNLEKTICDCARHRRLIGQDVLIEALRAYSKRPEKNIPRLMRYAQQFHVEALLRPYLEVLL